MSENLYDLLEGDDPVALRRIEKALMSADEHNETVDAVISALIWRRCTAGQNGVLGAVLNHECAARISVMADHLEKVGATEAAQVTRNLREEIPLADAQIRSGIIDWIDVHPEITGNVVTLKRNIDDIAPKVWSFMQERQEDLPDPQIPDKRKGLFGALFG
ncbi:hypothetical protein [Roseovarius sp. D0-M9]|uniref:hypothetical protein n=1 Tax=Roseovarius sp. D0-M9 TaxID=3127117 RepID=UPI00300FB41B